jgi:hypothetical protein
LQVAPLLILIAAIVAANLAVMALILVPPMLGRRSPISRELVPAVDAERRAAEAAIVGGLDGSATDDGVPTQTYDRVVRIVAWIFLLTTTSIVAATCSRRIPLARPSSSSRARSPSPWRPCSSP